MKTPSWDLGEISHHWKETCVKSKGQTGEIVNFLLQSKISFSLEEVVEGGDTEREGGSILSFRFPVSFFRQVIAEKWVLFSLASDFSYSSIYGFLISSRGYFCYLCLLWLTTSIKALSENDREGAQDDCSGWEWELGAFFLGVSVLFS